MGGASWEPSRQLHKATSKGGQLVTFQTPLPSAPPCLPACVRACGADVRRAGGGAGVVAASRGGGLTPAGRGSEGSCSGVSVQHPRPTPTFPTACTERESVHSVSLVPACNVCMYSRSSFSPSLGYFLFCSKSFSPLYALLPIFFFLTILLLCFHFSLLWHRCTPGERNLDP